jgi:nitroreductase
MASPAEPEVIQHAFDAGRPRSPQLVALAQALIDTRQTTLPKRLGAPGPDAEQTQAILAAAAQAPDHHQLLPWRWVLVPTDARAVLGEAFAAALIERSPGANADQLAQAREKAFRAPLLLLAVVRLHDADADIPPHERIVSAGCALQNMLLMAHAMGFGAALTSGQSLASAPLRGLFGLGEHEQALCFVNIGSVVKSRPVRVRPSVAEYVTTLTANQDTIE